MEWEFHSREWNPVDFPKPGLETSTLGLGVRLSDGVATESLAEECDEEHNFQAQGRGFFETDVADSNLKVLHTVTATCKNRMERGKSDEEDKFQAKGWGLGETDRLEEELRTDG